MDNNSKVWKITGYVGHSDYDGPEDNNFIKYIVFDKCFSKETVIDFMTHYFSKKYPVVYINAEDRVGQN